MATLNFSGSSALEKKLREMAARAEKAKLVKVGFLEGATYPDGTPVAKVAAIQNAGAPAASIPARPFFSNMARVGSPQWGNQLGKIMVATGYDAARSMILMGEKIRDDLVESIKRTNEPALSPITLMIRKMRMENPDLQVGGRIIGEAAARVAKGDSTAGVSTKALNYTGHLQNSADYEVT